MKRDFPKRNPHHSFAAFVVLAMIGVSGAAAQDLDHYNPVQLNEYALQKLREGDVATAAILLERAVLLAPEHPGIRSNLETLKASISGKDPAPAVPYISGGISGTGPGIPSSGGSSSDMASTGAIAPPPPFPIWPREPAR